MRRSKLWLWSPGLERFCSEVEVGLVQGLRALKKGLIQEGLISAGGLTLLW